MACKYKSKRYNRMVRIKHRPALLPLIFATVDRFDPALFIELGTLDGGFTLALFEHFGKRFEIVTFDIVLRGKRAISGICKGVKFHRADVLRGRDLRLIDLVKSPVRKVLYCDNGNKIAEVNKYAPMLNPGDMLGVHDWLTRPPLHMRPQWYQEKRRKMDRDYDDAVTDPAQIAGALADFEPYDWERYEGHWHMEDGVPVCDDTHCSRFWVKR